MPSVLELAARRRTVREFSGEGVSLGDVLKALDAARHAPSGANSQPWRFLIVTDPEVKARIRRAAEEGERRFYSRVSGGLREWLLSMGFGPEKPFLEEAPVLVLVFSKSGAPYSIQSTWLAVGYILLALEEAGLGTVTYTPSDPAAVAAAAGAPDDLILQVVLPVGRPAGEGRQRPRLGLDEVCRLNDWETPCAARGSGWPVGRG